MGLAYFVTSFSYLTGPPISGALLTTQNHWSKPIIFNGVSTQSLHVFVTPGTNSLSPYQDSHIREFTSPYHSALHTGETEKELPRVKQNPSIHDLGTCVLPRLCLWRSGLFTSLLGSISSIPPQLFSRLEGGWYS